VNVLRRIRILIGVMLTLCVLSTIAVGQTLSLSQSSRIKTSGMISGSNLYSYIIFKEGSYTVLQDGGTGAEVTRNTDATSVINEALSLGVSKNPILATAGNYSVSNNVVMKSNTVLILEAGVTIEATYTAQQVASGTGEGIIQFRGSYTSHVVNAQLICQDGLATIKGKGDSAWEWGIELIYADGNSVKGIEVRDTGGVGIYVRLANDNVLENLYVHGYGKYCGDPFAGSSDTSVGVLLHGGNLRDKLNDLHVDGENLKTPSGRGNSGSPLMFDSGWGEIRYNEVNGGIYERSGFTHAIYWVSDSSYLVESNTATGGLSRACRGSGYSCGFKLNPTRYCRVNWTVDNCSSGIELGNGGLGGNVGNVVYATVTNVVKGLEMWTQGSTVNRNVEQNEIHINVTNASYAGIFFGGFKATAPSPGCHVMNNTIYATVRQCEKVGIRFGDSSSDSMTADREAKYNTFYVDLQANMYGILWDNTGFGRWNTFIGKWQNYYSQSGNAVIDTCTFIPS